MWCVLPKTDTFGQEIKTELVIDNECRNLIMLLSYSTFFNVQETAIVAMQVYILLFLVYPKSIHVVCGMYVHFYHTVSMFVR